MNYTCGFHIKGKQKTFLADPYWTHKGGKHRALHSVQSPWRRKKHKSQEQSNIISSFSSPVLQTNNSSSLLLLQVTHKIPESSLGDSNVQEKWSEIFTSKVGSGPQLHLWLALVRCWRPGQGKLHGWKRNFINFSSIGIYLTKTVHCHLVELLILLLTSSSLAWSRRNLWVIFRYGLSCSSRINCSTTCTDRWA